MEKWRCTEQVTLTLWRGGHYQTHSSLKISLIFHLLQKIQAINKKGSVLNSQRLFSSTSILPLTHHEARGPTLPQPGSRLWLQHAFSPSRPPHHRPPQKDKSQSFVQHKAFTNARDEARQAQNSIWYGGSTIFPHCRPAQISHKQ